VHGGDLDGHAVAVGRDRHGQAQESGVVGPHGGFVQGELEVRHGDAEVRGEADGQHGGRLGGRARDGGGGEGGRERRMVDGAVAVLPGLVDQAVGAVALRADPVADHEAREYQRQHRQNGHDAATRPKALARVGVAHRPPSSVQCDPDSNAANHHISEQIGFY
jgi:hypothetical protein